VRAADCYFGTCRLAWTIDIHNDATRLPRLRSREGASFDHVLKARRRPAPRSCWSWKHLPATALRNRGGRKGSSLGLTLLQAQVQSILQPQSSGGFRSGQGRFVRHSVLRPTGVAVAPNTRQAMLRAVPDAFPPFGGCSLRGES
jgi:hypothetical protein